MSKLTVATGVFCVLIGAAALFGVQSVMKATNTPEFCISCHSMSHPQAEWEGSSHFMNAKGVRAECVDCHIPEDGLHYVKAKFIALKDVWYTLTDKLPDKAAYEKHRLELAERVWNEMKENDSMTCRSCHRLEAMNMSEQKPLAQEQHQLAQQHNQTCIDCHKGLVHFLPDMPTDNPSAGELATHAGKFSTNDKTLYALTLSIAQFAGGGDVRVMPYAALTDWKIQGNDITATVQGWQQAGAESVVYTGLGQRIMVALIGDEVKEKLTVLNTVHDSVTDSDWKEVRFSVTLPKAALTANQNALNNFGNHLNQTHCSGCHAVIGTDHYTANQWIGVINSMKDRTAMSDDDVRMLTIYMQRHAKDIKGSAH